MKVVFISGAYRNSTEWGLVENIRHAEREAIKLWQQGYAVICPHKNTAHFGGLCPDNVWLEGDIEILKRCDIVYFLKGWRNSQGSRAEFAEATSLGLKILFEE